MNQEKLVQTLGPLLRKYGVVAVLGLMGLEIFLAHRRGEL